MTRQSRVSRPKQPSKARPTSRSKPSSTTPTVRRSPAPAASTSSVRSAADGLTGDGSSRQLPAGAHEVAGVPVGIALQVVLMLGLGLPEIAGRADFGHHL